MKKYRLKDISETDLISYKSALWTLSLFSEAKDFLFHPYPITQMFGVVQDLTLLFTLYHKLEIAEDVNNYLSRLNAIPKQISQVVETLKYQREKKIIPPRFAIEKSIQMITKFIDEKPENNIFYRHLEEKLANIEMAKKEDVLAKVKLSLQKKVYPAYRTLQEYLETMLPTAKNNFGVWALPRGEEYYAHCLAFHTTTNLSADEIHELGLQEVKKIEAEIRALLKKDGLNSEEKGVGEIIQEISKNKAFYYPNTAQGKQQCLDRFETILTRCRKELWPLFNIKPEAAVVVKPVPEHEQDGAPGAYYCSPSIDGSRAGAFYVNLSDMNDMAKYQMETLAVHEAEPGHHFQIAIENESSLPLLRKIATGYTAYIEGWALYTEKLAYEQNFYSTIYDQIGHLQYDLLRAARLVIDTGIHQKRWSREKAIEYMEKVTGMSNGDVVAEIERYFVLPGQACAYKIGQLKILELRERAKAELGEGFDIRDFHDIVLKTGSAPLSILEEAVDGYIERKKG